MQLKKKRLADTLSDSDIESCIVSAVRYSLGRMTYITGIMRDVIEATAGQLSNNAIHVIARDIERHGEECWKLGIANDGYGQDCDRDNWNDALDILRSEESARKSDGRWA